MEIKTVEGKALITPHMGTARPPEEWDKLNRKIEELINSDAVSCLNINAAEKKELKERLLYYINLRDWIDSRTSLKDLKIQLDKLISAGKRFMCAMHDLHSDGWRLIESEAMAKRNLEPFIGDDHITSYLLKLEMFIGFMVSDAESIREDLPMGRGGAPSSFLKARLIVWLRNYYEKVSKRPYKAGMPNSLKEGDFVGPGFVFIKSCLVVVGFSPVRDRTLHEMIGQTIPE